MPKLDVDAAIPDGGTISVVLDGKEYTITKVTQDVLDSVADAAKSLEASMKEDAPVVGDAEKKERSYFLARQMATIFGVDVEEFKDKDVRKIGAAFKFVFKTIMSQMDVVEPGAKKE